MRKNIPRNKGKQKHSDPKPKGPSKNSSKREIYSNIISSQKIRKNANYLTLHIKELEEGRSKTQNQ